jgi:hypothetical protein
MVGQVYLVSPHLGPTIAWSIDEFEVPNGNPTISKSKLSFWQVDFFYKKNSFTRKPSSKFPIVCDALQLDNMIFPLV